MADFDALPKHFDSTAVEGKWYERWEREGCFDSNPNPEGENYSILLPPPNVTGTLHMGHAFQHTLMDALIRRERMRGRSVLWQAGTDTRELKRKGVTPLHCRGRNFYATLGNGKRSRRHHHPTDAAFRRFLRLDTRALTMDEGLSLAVIESFVRLYEDGLIYRGKRLVNWDPELLTAVSDLEVISEEEDGVMYHVRYPFVDDEAKGITIATTRPKRFWWMAPLPCIRMMNAIYRLWVSACGCR